MNRRIMLGVVAVILAGCGSEKPAVQSTEPFHIANVEMVGPSPPNVGEWQIEDLRQQTMALAARVPQTANPRLLRLRIEDFHKKDAAMSLILGDANRLKVVAQVTTLDGAQPLGNFSALVTTDAFINGVVGAAVAASENSTEAAHDLNRKAANAILEKVYGTRAWKVWMRQR